MAPYLRGGGGTTAARWTVVAAWSRRFLVEGLREGILTQHGQESRRFGHGLRHPGWGGRGAGWRPAPGAPSKAGPGPVLGPAGRQARAGGEDPAVRRARDLGGDRALGPLLGPVVRERVPAGGTPHGGSYGEDGARRGR